MNIGIFTISKEISVSEVISAISLLGMFIGVIFSMTRLFFEKRFEHEQKVYELCEKQKSDEKIKKAIYLLDYGDEWYTEDFQRNPSRRDEQREFDNAINFYDHICYMRQKHLLTKEDYDFFIYDIKIILSNVQMRDYLYNLYHLTKNAGLPMLFQYLFKYGESEKMFDKDFYDENAYKKPECSKKYHHYIRFHKEEIEVDAMV